ncbi:MAG: beta-glucosidase [Maribacter sp.]|jgi:beta-glucosidase
MKKVIFGSISLVIIAFVFMVSNKKEQSKVDKLLAQMTLEEKIGQMNQYSSFFDATGPAPTKEGYVKQKYEDIKSGRVGSMLNVRGVKAIMEMQKLAVENSRLGIPMIFGYDVIHGHKTMFPIPLAESASWDLEAIEKSARIAAIEASAEGLNWTFAPMVDISRDARWGRVMEGAGEDPFLGSKIAAARVKGFQGDDLTANNTIAACAKHFVGYGFAESGKEYNTVDVGTSTLYNVMFPPFKAASDAGVKTFMNAFNELNGIPATADKFLQRDILKGEWNFEGFVVTDWGTIGELINHGYAENGAQAAELAVNAGSDMDMESHLYIKELEELVENGKVDLEKIDDAVRRILQVKFDLGLFDDPYRYCSEEREKELIYHKDHKAAALDIAKKSIVLLKNEGNLLPLSKDNNESIAVIGALADDKNSPLGNWRLAADDNSAVSVWEGMNSYPNKNIKLVKGPKLVEKSAGFAFPLTINTTDRNGFKEAVALAKESKKVIMVLGEYGYQSGEGRSRADIGLPGFQQELLEAVHAVNPNIILVLMNGRPLALPWADEHIPSILETWHLGIESGNAIAQVLHGDYNPSGKLPMTFPRNVGQIPIYYNYKNTGRPGPEAAVFWSHYTDETNAPLYHFGYGLSYTTFDYADLKVEVNPKGKSVKVTVNIKNTGQYKGEEVAQLYIRDKVASVTRPVKELKAFEKFELAIGESKSVIFNLTEKELGFYNNQGEFIFEKGEFEIMVGGSSQTELSETVLLD